MRWKSSAPSASLVMERKGAFWAPMSMDQFDKIPNKWPVLIFISDPFEPDFRWCQSLKERSIKITHYGLLNSYLELCRFTSENLPVWKNMFELLLKALLWIYHNWSWSPCRKHVLYQLFVAFNKISLPDVFGSKKKFPLLPYF